MQFVLQFVLHSDTKTHDFDSIFIRIKLVKLDFMDYICHKIEP